MKRVIPTKGIFYVYEHWRPDRNVCFYVGKGKDDRAWRKRSRCNRFYLRIVGKLKKLGLEVEVKIVASGLAEGLAFALERQRIAFWRASGVRLANVTDGGEGCSGLKHSAKTKEILRQRSLAVMSIVMANPEIRLKLSKAVTIRMKEPKALKNLSRKQIIVMSDPEIRKARGVSMTKS